MTDILHQHLRTFFDNISPWLVIISERECVFSAVWAVSEEVDCLGIPVIHSTSSDTNNKYDVRRVRDISNDLQWASYYDTKYGENFHWPV